MYCSTVPMLSNFKKRFFDRCPPPQEQQPFLSPSESQSDASDTERTDDDDPVAQHWDAAMAETVYVPGCTCDFCVMRSENDGVADSMCNPDPPSRSHARRSLPSFRSVMEVLYSPSHLGTTFPFPDPPSYSRDSLVSPVREDDSEIAPLMLTTATSAEGTPLSRSHRDPLTQDPLVTGVPSQGTPSTRVLVEPNSLTVALDSDVPEEPLPAYSRFDQCRPRFPAASDILGPYPPMSVLCRSAR